MVGSSRIVIRPFPLRQAHAGARTRRPELDRRPGGCNWRQGMIDSCQLACTTGTSFRLTSGDCRRRVSDLSILYERSVAMSHSGAKPALLETATTRVVSSPALPRAGERGVVWTLWATYGAFYFCR